MRAVHPRPGASTRAIADITWTRADLPPQSTPKQKNADSSSSSNQPLYPISAAPQYPTAQQVQSFLSKSRITETELLVDNVETLLNVLVLDGDIERVSLSPYAPSLILPNRTLIRFPHSARRHGTPLTTPRARPT